MQCDAIHSSTSDDRVDGEVRSSQGYSNEFSRNADTAVDAGNEGLNPNTSVNDSIISVGGVVQIKGLVGAQQFNVKMGCVVSDVDPTTNRCGVKLHSNKLWAFRCRT